MRSRLILAALAFVLGLLPQAAQAICDMTLRSVRSVNFSGSGSYNVFATSEAGQTIFIRVRHTKSDACSYFVTFSKGQSGSYDRAMSGPGAVDLHYQFYDTPSKSNVLKEIPEATASEVLSGSFGTAAETQDLSYYIAIAPGQMVPAGSYADSITVRLYEGTLASYTQRDQATFAVDASVDDVLQMCVVSCGAPFDPFATSRTMAFGTMNTGDWREIDLLVRGNVAYEVLFRSDNKGVMAEAGGKGEVPYTLTLNGAAVDLTSGLVTAVTGTGPTPMGGDRYHLLATIGSLSAAVAGNYQDNIAITVRAR